MHVIKLADGAEAPIDSDCVKIISLSGGRFRLLSSALFEGDSAGDESVAVVGGDTYATFEAAEAAGLTWANEQGVETLYLERAREKV